MSPIELLDSVNDLHLQNFIYCLITVGLIWSFGYALHFAWFPTQCMQQKYCHEYNFYRLNFPNVLCCSSYTAKSLS